MGFWESVANALRASRIGRQAEVDSGPMRESNAELLLGENGWVNHKEHGVIYCFDATKVMFSAGNISERGYTGKINASGEIVVDLYDSPSAPPVVEDIYVNAGDDAVFTAIGENVKWYDAEVEGNLLKKCF